MCAQAATMDGISHEPEAIVGLHRVPKINSSIDSLILYRNITKLKNTLFYMLVNKNLIDQKSAINVSISINIENMQTLTFYSIWTRIKKTES